MRRALQAFSVTVFVFWAGAGLVGAEERKDPATNFDNHKPLADAVRKADKVVLYEGLPHPAFEKKLLEDERKTKKIVNLHGYEFYAEPIRAKEADAEKLTALYRDPKSFKPFSGPKKCGGFHPDYCIEWHVGKDVYRALLCFGCSEMKSFGPKTELYCDLTEAAQKQLKDVLEPYRKNRPKGGAAEK